MSNEINMNITTNDTAGYIHQMAVRARAAASGLGALTAEAKNNALLSDRKSVV